MSDQANVRLLTLQYLRAVAALLVVFNHSEKQITGLPQLFPDELWACGVDIFFVISGFVITHVSYRREGQVGRFMAERIIRIVPLYWIFTFLTAALLLALPNVFRNSDLSLDHLLLSLAFVPHPHPLLDTFSPLLRIGWTLLFEMHFYLLFAAAMLLSFRRRLQIVGSVLVLLPTIGWIARPEGVVIGFYLNDIMLEFLFGMVLAVLYRKGRLVGSPLAAGALIAVGFCILGFGGAAFGPDFETVPRALVWGVPAAMVTAGTLMLNRPNGRVWRLGLLTGDASYALYLVHLFPISALRIVWTKLGLPATTILDSILFHLAAIVVSLIAAYAVYLLIDEPLHRRLKTLVTAWFTTRRERSGRLVSLVKEG